MRTLENLQKEFINLRLGTFIHFNSATMQFHTGEIKDWEFDHENGKSPRLYPFAEKDWNPQNPDCAQWAAAARSSGCRFAALTAKHHEGFALWPTAYSEHSVKNGTNKTDVVAAYLKAFREAGIAAGLYFSILDLTAGIGRRSCTEKQKEMIKGQITELLTHYGEIPFLIVDGWNAPWGGPSYDMLPFEEIDGLVKLLQPNCLLANIGCTEGIENTDIVFFENGAGQEITAGFEGPGVLCQKFTGTWFWREEDPETKTASAEWAAGLLKKCNAVNVNLMLNISPNKEGRMDENLAAAFSSFGELQKTAAPLQEIPAGWLKRKK
ncbi:MAG: alpha-L-fucosidase [Lachnospiraceae bacterium]|nr:alpha-L-fucosidase [Lachnospiraceae bacterium]